MKDIENILNKSPQKLEEKILKAIFRHQNCLLDTIGKVEPEMFTISEYGNIYHAMVELFKKSTDVNAETVKLFLDENNIPIDTNIIQKLFNEGFTGVKIGNTINIFKELYQRRYMLNKLKAIVEEQDLKPTSSEDILNSINNVAMNSNDVISNSDKNTKCCDSVNNFMVEINQKLSSKIEEKGLKTGIHVIDNNLNGLLGGRLWVITADSQVGKSALAVQLSVSACLLNDNARVEYYSLEVDSEEIRNRALAVLTGVEPNYIDNPKRFFTRYDKRTNTIRNYYEENKNCELVTEFKQKLKEGAEQLNSFNLYVDDESDLNTDSLVARIKKNALQRGVPNLIVVDHIGLVTQTSSISDMVSSIETFYVRMKQLAKKLNTCILCLHQFNNELKNSPDRRPNIFMLKGGVSAKNQADVALSIYRPEVYPDLMKTNPELKDVCEIDWLKCRYTKKPETTPMSYNGYMFEEKAPTSLQGEIINGEVYLDSEGNFVKGGKNE